MPQVNNPNAFCHRLVRQTARAMAREVWETAAGDREIGAEFRAAYPERAAYVRTVWPMMLEEARESLAKLLTTGLSEPLKADIVEALTLDNTLRAGRAKFRWN